MKKGFSKNRIPWIAAIFAFILLCVIAFDSRMIVRRYEIEAAEVSAPVRIALVTDLHTCYYGEGQTTLLGAIDDCAPDLILLGGDIFDDNMDDTNTETFLSGVSGKYPCYYVTGNHEYWSERDAFAAKMAILEKYGITILSGDCETIEINGDFLNICGVDDPDSYMIQIDMAQDLQGYMEAEIEKYYTFNQQLDKVSAMTENGNYTILLSHRPELFEHYVSRGFDLVLCGHAHGGQWRIPRILNGLYAPNQGLFPQYAGGQYDSDATTMIVSRGLARESTRLPRIFNRPELVLVEIR